MSKCLYVYILECSDNSYYTGITNNLSRRVKEHNSGTGYSSYTYPRRPVRLVYYEEYANFYVAIERETQIKCLSRKKKNALIERDLTELKNASLCKNASSHLMLGQMHVSDELKP